MRWRRRNLERDAVREIAAATVGEPMDPDAILELRNLCTTFHTDEGAVHAVDDVSLRIRRGSTTCIVGESGSGKSATARSIIQVVDHPGRVDSGQVLYRPTPDGAVVDLAALNATGPGIRSIRGRDIGLVFQEPMSSLSPVHTIGDQIGELLELHERLSPQAAKERVIDDLRRVGIPRPEERFGAYTFQLSGGMRQRAMIAMALVCRPSLLIADEPTTALDVTTQAQILDLLAELKQSLGMTLMFITHDLGVVAEIADDVVVMRHGKVVEHGPVDQIFHDPRHEYTQELLAALPQRGAVTVTEPEPVAEASPRPLLRIEDLEMTFEAAAGTLFGRRRTERVNAVDKVTLDIPEGSTVGLVGESGCGKTTLGRCVLRAYRPTAGKLLYAGADGRVTDLARLSEKELLPFRRQIRMVFQDPYGSLNPRMTVRQVVGEPLRVAGLASGSELDGRVEDMLERVGLKRSMAGRYPHAFSGGERQRIGIARALITEPRLVVADEAVSALDVSVRTQILELLAELQDDLGLTYLFISHDLSVVERICDQVAVMYFGVMVEQGPAEQVFADPEHGYTRALLSAVPVADPRERGTRERVAYEPEPA
ncbi:peptide/nickel transport system ATP-binding protein [Jiangella alba]|uniref:Peptide/nickel transport system ATP-binding protein n=2 Tax=Jiangella alba TaxID=561176 RepID=A0A1H5JRW7_9ACTN|nr:ABC transporter ATP-binding protein [Jiangella alba]SEE55305.1 peptide/nickel transport system ATP-binding protein [Jiangella alba]